MTPRYSETTDPQLRSHVPVPANSDFPIQNLPYGVFSSTAGRTGVGVRIGDYILDLTLLEQQGLLPTSGFSGVFAEPSLNRFLSLGRPAWREMRRRISALLRVDSAGLRDNIALREAALLPIGQCRLQLPARIGDYTDFYSSREHATNVGTMFRGKENALMPNWLWIPIGYHGRASSIVVSGTDIRRPSGQTRGAADTAPEFGPTRELDFELEMGFLVGGGNPLGRPIPIAAAEEHIFGMVLVNDWSARDVQRWEYVPLGPFLAKNFATSISPWVVPLEALEPFRCHGPEQHPPALPYLQSPLNSHGWTYDIKLQVRLQSESVSGAAPISNTNFRFLYWSMIQQLAHHASNGCNLLPGDLLASGTISGPTPDSYGSLLELAWKGERPVDLGGGLTRTFLNDFDRLTLAGWCDNGELRIGFGECTGRILPAE